VLAVGLVVNRAARRLREDGPLLRALRPAGGAAWMRFETWTLADLEESVRELHAQGVRRVVLAGGDGTYMAGVTALRRAYGEAMPEIAFAPGGTVSTTARNWGMHGDLVRHAERVLRAASSKDARVVLRPTLRVTTETRDDRGFIFGAGLVASFFDAYYASPHQGYAGAARIVARIFVGAPFGGKLARKVLTPSPCTIAVDGVEQAPRAFSLIAASVVRDLGLHMLVTYRAEERDDAVHVVASPLGPARLGPQMPLVLAGKRLLGRDHVDTLAKKLELRFPAESTYVLDGERFRAAAIAVTRGEPIRLLSP
jgi:diacylglycerol kinase family enzyme